MADPNSRGSTGADNPGIHSSLRPNAMPYQPSFSSRYQGVPTNQATAQFPGAHGGYASMVSPRQYPVPKPLPGRPAATPNPTPVTVPPKKILSICHPQTGIALVGPDMNPADFVLPAAAKSPVASTTAPTRVPQPAIITEPPASAPATNEAGAAESSEAKTQSPPTTLTAGEPLSESTVTADEPAVDTAIQPSASEVVEPVPAKQEAQVPVAATSEVKPEESEPVVQPQEAQAASSEISQVVDTKASTPAEKPKYTLEFLLGLKDKFKEATPAIKELISKIDTSAGLFSPTSRNQTLANKSNTYYGRPGNRSQPQRSSSSNSVTSHHNHDHGRSHNHGYNSNHSFSSHSSAHTPRDTPRSLQPPLARAAKELSEEQKILADAKSLLNKLAPQTFEKLFKKFLELSLKTPDVLKGVIKILFEMALNQGIFCPMYAQFCRELNRSLPKFEGEFAGQTFRKILLNTCQEEFEREKQPAPEGLNSHDSWEFELKRRKRQIGNIRFIGEIYKIKMLPDVIIEECIATLISQSELDSKNGMEIDAESVECLCQLLVNIGSQFSDAVKPEEKEANKVLIQHAFEHLEKIKSNPKTESRIRFMIMDAEDVRLNNWVNRRQENKPKTIEEVRKEALEEQLASIENAKSLPPPPPSRQDGRGSGPRVIQRYDMNKTAETTSALRPNWQDRGRSGKSGRNENTSIKVKTQAPVQQRTTSAAPQSSSAPTQASAVTSSLSSSVAQASPYASLTTDALIKKMRGVVDEYLATGVTEELLETLGDMSRHKEGKMVCFKMYELIGTCKDADRQKLISSFTMILEKKIWSDEVFFEGTIQLVSNLEDLKCDSPRIIQLTSAMYAKWILSGLVPLSFLFSPEGVLPKIDKSGIYGAVIVEFICAVLKAIQDNSVEAFTTLTAGLQVRVQEYLPEGDDFSVEEAKKIISDANISLVKLE